MRYFKLIPQMFGSSGEGTIGDADSIPANIQFLNFYMDDTPIDDIGKESGIILITDRLKTALEKISPSGVSFRKDGIAIIYDKQITSSADYVPADYWLAMPSGVAGIDDFAFSDAYLTVSERVLDVLQSFVLKWCTILDYSP